MGRMHLGVSLVGHGEALANADLGALDVEGIVGADELHVFLVADEVIFQKAREAPFIFHG